ncbi:UvrD-helicase domain-containing protein [Marispirochaeta sp.]|jgi:hypothetical protein|uniref:UvrD-helicase domain-containing protein n=1 Tax=Marispirochaeta sp. TaxID=2038653 RepID=UPI00374A029C
MQSIEYYWKKTGFEPNTAQRNAILHNAGPLFLTAGPGSGKTQDLASMSIGTVHSLYSVSTGGVGV